MNATHDMNLLKKLRHLVALAALAILGASALSADTALAVTDQLPGWAVIAKTKPTYLHPGGNGAIQIKVLNDGAASSKGTVTVTDVLPPGVTAINAGADERINHAGPGESEVAVAPGLWECSGDTPGGLVAGAKIVTCVNNLTNFPSLAGGGGTPTGPGDPLPPPPFEGNEEIAIGVTAPAQEGPTSAPNRVTVAGGGALGSASTQEQIMVSSSPPPFGFADATAYFSNADGTTDTQAGSHPYEATFAFDMNHILNPETFPAEQPAGGEIRNLLFNLPPGFIGNPTAVARCTRVQFNEQQCPPASQVGIIAAEVLGESYRPGGVAHDVQAVYNVVPPAGQPAAIGFQISEVNTLVGTYVRSGGDYGLTAHANNIAQRDVIGSVLTLWGVPGDASHAAFHGGFVASGGAPFLTLPTSCLGPQNFSLSVNTWTDASLVARTSFVSHNALEEQVGFTGCEALDFGTSIVTAPDTGNADTPVGLTAEVKPELGGLMAPEGLGTADIKNTTVTLPEGVVINPGQAAGLVACKPGEDGLTTQAEKQTGQENSGEAHCPGASKVGTVEIETPLLPHSLHGDVFVMQSEPPEIKLLVTASGEGVNLKLVGTVHLDERTGRLETTFNETPSLPFTVFRLAFSGGAQAALDTPTHCGTYTATSDFMPWGSPLVADVSPVSAFALTAGPGGSGCPSSPLPFAPVMTAGSTTDQAGGFTNFSLLLQRGDGQQRIEKLAFREPAGLAGLISSVPLCDEANANAGTCPAASRIGHAVVASGPGPYPLVLPQPGAPELPIYLTGPYKGAPFGLSIVTPVIAGPFNLGTVITRAKIEVDLYTAQITITTDPLPQIVKGVPTDLRSINSIIDRPGFLFNPTNCSPQEFTGTAWGVAPPGASEPGQTAAISSHFGMGSCQSLKFKPRFSVSASGRNSKAGGASLSVTLAYPSEPQGSEANIAKVKVALPKQLPSRLTTLQKACTAAQFASNPAGCPVASVVGHAVVHTPVLPVPLEGPAYFVSNGGEAFPNLIMVLQGYGVTVDLVGDTFINKQGITSSTFKATPDVPFSTFQLTLPQGPNSALATNVPAGAQYSLCGQKLTMPTELVAQNGAVISQSTPIGITSCAKKKSLTRAQKLAVALKACHKKHAHAKRAACERQARRRYGPGKSKKK
jgi:hypothetical protein